jgi:hypothetical protein
MEKFRKEKDNRKLDPIQIERKILKLASNKSKSTIREDDLQSRKIDGD